VFLSNGVVVMFLVNEYPLAAKPYTEKL